MSEDRHIDKGDLIGLTASETGHSQKTATEIINGFLDQIGRHLAYGSEVRLINFGKFDRRWRKPRQATNLQTGEPTMVQGHYAVHFKPAKELKDKVQ